MESPQSHRRSKVTNPIALPSPAAPQVVIITTQGATCDNKSHQIGDRRLQRLWASSIVAPCLARPSVSMILTIANIMGVDSLAMQVQFQPQGTTYPTYMYHVGQTHTVIRTFITRILSSFMVNTSIMCADGLTTQWVTQCGNENIPGDLGLCHCCWCCDSLHHQAINTGDINDAGQSSPSCWKIVTFACNFSMAFETWMIMSYFRKNLFHFSLFYIEISVWLYLLGANDI